MHHPVEGMEMERLAKDRGNWRNFADASNLNKSDSVLVSQMVVFRRLRRSCHNKGASLQTGSPLSHMCDQ